MIEHSLGSQSLFFLWQNLARKENHTPQTGSEGWATPRSPGHTQRHKAAHRSAPRARPLRAPRWDTPGPVTRDASGLQARGGRVGLLRACAHSRPAPPRPWSRRPRPSSIITRAGSYAAALRSLLPLYRLRTRPLRETTPHPRPSRRAPPLYPARLWEIRRLRTRSPESTPEGLRVRAAGFRAEAGGLSWVVGSRSPRARRGSRGGPLWPGRGAPACAPLRRRPRADYMSQGPAARRVSFGPQGGCAEAAAGTRFGTVGRLEQGVCEARACARSVRDRGVCLCETEPGLWKSGEGATGVCWCECEREGDRPECERPSVREMSVPVCERSTSVWDSGRDWVGESVVCVCKRETWVCWCVCD